ncbi:MAG TPA: rhomboid family protein [Verrucomicrobiae bacterium]|nr:rhomboid family protein [Verrucomicrobiae bacterium]
MPDLALQRCLNHAEREAVALCPHCRRYFCRECITEHEDRVICAGCLTRLARVPLLQRRGVAEVLRAGQAALGLLLVWFFFFIVGRTLLSLPAAFHDATLWKPSWWNLP